MKTITYTRPSGSTLEVADNEANRAYAESLGWVVAKDTKAQKDKKAAK